MLTATAQDILAQPRFPLIKVNLKVVPSDESWAAVDQILAGKEGLCGYVVDKVNVRGIVQKLVDKGFNVRLPTEKIKPMAVPVGIEPTMEVRGQPVALWIKLGESAITEQVIWLGARVSVAVGEEAAKQIEEKKAQEKEAPTGKAPAGKPPPRRPQPESPSRKSPSREAGSRPAAGDLAPRFVCWRAVTPRSCACVSRRRRPTRRLGGDHVLLPPPGG